MRAQQSFWTFLVNIWVEYIFPLLNKQLKVAMVSFNFAGLHQQNSQYRYDDIPQKFFAVSLVLVNKLLNRHIQDLKQQKCKIFKYLHKYINVCF